MEVVIEGVEDVPYVMRVVIDVRCVDRVGSDAPSCYCLSVYVHHIR